MLIGGNEVHMPREQGKAHKKLVKNRLVIHHHQALPAAQLLARCHFYMAFQLGPGLEKQRGQQNNHIMTPGCPALCFIFRFRLHTISLGGDFFG